MQGHGRSQAGGSILDPADPYKYSSLAASVALLGLDPGEIREGWTAESSRLFAIDCAVISYRRRLDIMAEAERKLLNELLNEARRLTVAKRQRELDFIQHEIAKLVGSLHSLATREAWLVAADALLPSPFRAAQVTAESVLKADGRRPGPDRDATVFRIRERLLARTREATYLRTRQADLSSKAISNLRSNQFSA